MSNQPSNTKPPTDAELARARKLLESAGYRVSRTDRVATRPKPTERPIFACWNPEHRHRTGGVAAECNAKRATVQPTDFKKWTMQEKTEALRLHRLGMSFDDIGEKFGVSAGSAQGAVRWALLRERRRLSP